MGLPPKPGLGAKGVAFRFGGGDARTAVLGSTGSGKSTNGLWQLAHQRLDKRPWIIVDFKREVILDRVGFPPLRPLRYADKLPRKPGLYVISPKPGEDDAIDDLMWRIWEHENIGIFVDECTLMPLYSNGFAACYQQGRSKRIPIIACSQRPAKVPVVVFTEAQFFCVYRLMERDYKTVRDYVPGDFDRPLEPYYWRWYDVAHNIELTMQPVPSPERVAEMLALRAPNTPSAWHPFTFTSKPSGQRVKLT